MPIVLSRVVSWLRKQGTALLWGLLGLLGVGAFLAVRRRLRALALADADSTVIEARAQVRELRATRAALAEDSVVRADEIALIDLSIDSHKSRIASVQKQHGLTAEEISSEFSKLGY
jgi:hypothetical protein